MSHFQYFYINADVQGGWPFEAEETLCKFGLTSKEPERRLRENQALLRQWGIEANLRLCFLALGQIASEGVEGKVGDHTLFWLPDGFEQSSEWRQCSPRQLARIAVLIAEGRCRSGGLDKPESRAPVTHRPPALERENGNVELSCLYVPGTKIRQEPLASGGKKETGREARPLREPIPWAAPRDGISPNAQAEGISKPKEESPQPETKRAIGEEPVPGTGLFDRDVFTKLRQSHRELRQRNLFAEQRALRRASRTSGGDGPNRNALLNVRVRPLHDKLLDEASHHSLYRSRSAYIRATGTGRDRTASIVAKAGIFSCWALAHLEEKVGEEEWEELRELTRLLFGEADVGRALKRTRKHLLARHLLAEDGGSVPKEALPPNLSVGNRSGGQQGLPGEDKRGYGKEGRVVGTRAGGKDVLDDLKDLASTEKSRTVQIRARISKERKRLIRENAAHSDYDSMSSCLRHLLLGWDRSRAAVAQSATVAHWISARLGEQIRRGQWEELGRLMRRRFRIFLFGARGEKDPHGSLQRGAEHLLGTSLETVAEETKLPLQPAS